MLKIIIKLIRWKRKMNSVFRFWWYGAQMKYNIRTGRIGNDMKIEIKVPHGRKWVKHYTHQFVIDANQDPSVQLRGELHLALKNAGLADIDNNA